MRFFCKTFATVSPLLEHSGGGRCGQFNIFVELGTVDTLRVCFEMVLRG